MKVNHGINFVVLFIIALSDCIEKLCRLKHSCGEVYYVVQGCSSVFVCTQNPKSATIQMKAIEQFFHVVLFIKLYKVVLTSISMVKYIFVVVAQTISKSYLVITEPTYV